MACDACGGSEAYFAQKVGGSSAPSPFRGALTSNLIKETGAGMKIRYLVLTLTLFLPLPALAETDVTSGNFMHEGCKGYINNSNKSNFKQGICVGIITTIFYYRDFLPKSSRFCTPQDMTVEQSIRIVVSYMDKHPNRLNENFKDTAADALQDAWPCP